MTEYKVVCDGRGSHPERLLGVLIDDRKPFDAAATRQSYERLRSMTDQLLPDRDRSEDRSIVETVRSEALARSKLQYRGTRRRLTHDESVYYATSSENSLEVRYVQHGREFTFSCWTCRAQRASQAVWKFSERQVERVVADLKQRSRRKVEIMDAVRMSRGAQRP